MDTRRTLFLWLTAVLAGLPASAGGRPEFDVSVTSSGLVVAAASIDGHGPYPFIVDTGATTTTVDENLASRLELKAPESIRIVTLNGSFDAPLLLVDMLTIGKLQLGPARVASMPLGELGRDGSRIAGIIGQDVLRRHVLTVDYTRRRAMLSARTCDTGDTAVAIQWADGRPMVEAHVLPFAGAQRLVIDSAANALILFVQDAPGGSSGEAQVLSHRGAARGRFVPRARVIVGGLNIQGPAALLSPREARTEDGLLPASWFSRVCIDGPRAQVVLTR